MWGSLAEETQPDITALILNIYQYIFFSPLIILPPSNTGFSLCAQQSWELLLVSKLGWDLSPVTAGDFVDHLLNRVPVLAREPIVRRHATTFVALAATGKLRTGLCLGLGMCWCGDKNFYHFRNCFKLRML